MDPIDPGAALHGVDRAGRADDHHRDAVAPGVEDRHRAVHQPDIGVQRDRKRLAGDAALAMRDRDRALLVQAEQHLGLVAEIIDEAVMQAAEARARRQRDIVEVHLPQHFREWSLPRQS